jgi:hypothetical protein
MSFHKRYIRSETILAKYKDSGIDGIKKLFSADAIFLSDDFSSEIHRLLMEGELLSISNLIKSEQKKHETL